MSGAATREWQRRWQHSVMDTYGTPPVVLASGSGARVVDVDGKEYVDLVAGIAVNALGHAHPAVVAAVSRQVATLGHTSNLAVNRPAVELSERLLAIDGRPGQVFLCNSGAEANEAAFKLARRTGRVAVVAAEGSFHGRTSGALSLTGQPAKREPFGPLVPGVRFVPYGDLGALEDALAAGDVAAVFLEPVQGEAGVVVPPTGYLAGARHLTAATGTLLVLDEVQTGIGRTGRWFAHQAERAEPDVVTLAKGLGGGLPLGACIAYGDAAHLLTRGQHGSTFGGNPVACAAALAVLDTVERDGLLDRAGGLGARLRAGLSVQPGVAEVRGVGLLCGVRLVDPVARELEDELRQAGFLTNATSPDVLRLAPPLVVDESDLDAFVDAWPAAVARLPVGVP